MARAWLMSVSRNPGRPAAQRVREQLRVLGVHGVAHLRKGAVVERLASFLDDPAARARRQS